VKDRLVSKPAGSKLVDVEWAIADALPFDLAIQVASGTSGSGASDEPWADAAGNVMIADHGVSLPPDAMLGLPEADINALRPNLIPPEPIAGERWQPVLDQADIARTQPFGPVPGKLPDGVPASALASVDPGKCLPALALEDEFATWTSKRDLLDSSSFDRNFVIEEEIDGRAALRFGDLVNGLAPNLGTVLVPRGRFGFGPRANIGIGALAHIVLKDGGADVALTVTNPLPATGGAASESVEHIRIAAPQAFRRQERAVSAPDYAAAAKLHPDVQNAVAVPRWTGAWQTMLVFVDRKGGAAVDGQFRRAMLDHLETFRLMGFDIAVEAARSVPLDIELAICAKPGMLRSQVAARVRQALDPDGPPGDAIGFFHPDNFTFGSPLYLSRLIAAVITVDGVQSVTASKFHPLGRTPQGELEKGVISPGVLEVLQLDDDPSFPENGRLALTMGGGR